MRGQEPVDIAVGALREIIDGSDSAPHIFDDHQPACRIGLNALIATLADDARESLDFGRNVECSLPDTAAKRSLRSKQQSLRERIPRAPVEISQWCAARVRGCHQRHSVRAISLEPEFGVPAVQSLWMCWWAVSRPTCYTLDRKMTRVSIR